MSHSIDHWYTARAYDGEYWISIDGSGAVRSYLSSQLFAELWVPHMGSFRSFPFDLPCVFRTTMSNLHKLTLCTRKQHLNRKPVWRGAALQLRQKARMSRLLQTTLQRLWRKKPCFGTGRYHVVQLVREAQKKKKLELGVYWGVSVCGMERKKKLVERAREDLTGKGETKICWRDT